MKFTKVVKTAFIICTLLSLLFSALLLVNARAIKKYATMIDAGRQMLESVLIMELQEKDYLLHQEEESVVGVKDRIDVLRKSVLPYERGGVRDKSPHFFEVAMWEEAVNLYERLFDQFVLYHGAVEKNIAEIRNLEKRILAVIFSKMNPERGIIALQEIRIHEKGYLLYRDTGPPSPDEKPFEDKRKDAVSNLLLWAQNDSRIQELIDEDNQLFDQIRANYQGQDHTILLIEKERTRIKDMAEGFLEAGKNGLYVGYRRCTFLATMVAAMWLVVGLGIVAGRTN